MNHLLVQRRTHGSQTFIHASQTVALTGHGQYLANELAGLVLLRSFCSLFYNSAFLDVDRVPVLYFDTCAGKAIAR